MCDRSKWFGCTIKANVSLMFDAIEPWSVSNSEANLGDSCAQRTWSNALKIAGEHAAWLTTPLATAADGMRHWAQETGAWEDAEIASWSDVEALALFAQNIAHECREFLKSDDLDLWEGLTEYQATDYDDAPEYPIGYYFAGEIEGTVHVEYSTEG